MGSTSSPKEVIPHRPLRQSAPAPGPPTSSHGSPAGLLSTQTFSKQAPLGHAALLSHGIGSTLGGAEGAALGLELGAIDGA